MKNILVIVIILFISLLANFGQQSCTQNLLDAQKLFEQGFLEDVPEQLTTCLINKGFTKEERVDAYKLIILAYLYDDRHNDAEKYMAKFLKDNPEYELTETDPDVFVYLYSQYNTDPVISVGPVIGGAFSFLRVIHKNSTSNSENNLSSYGHSGIALNGGIGIYRNIKNQFNVDLNILFNQMNFVDNDTIPDNANMENDLTWTEFDYKVSRIGIPLTFTYDFYYRNLIPYLSAGGGLGIILKNEKRTNSINNAISPLSKYPPQETIDNAIGSYFKKFHWWLSVGGGLKIPISSGMLLVDIKYNFGILNFMNPNNIYDIYDIMNMQMIPPDKARIENFIITASYRYSIYNPKRKKVK